VNRPSAGRLKDRYSNNADGKISISSKQRPSWSTDPSSSQVNEHLCPFPGEKWPGSEDAQLHLVRLTDCLHIGLPSFPKRIYAVVLN